MEWNNLMRRGRKEVGGAWAIAKKDMRIYYFKPPVIMFGVLTPVFMFLSFMVRRQFDASHLIPGLTAMVLFFGASSVTSAVIPWERGQQTFERLLMAPVSVFAVLWGKAIAGAVFGALVAVVPLLIGTFAFDMEVDQSWLLVVAVIVSTFSFAALGVLFASLRRSQLPGDIMMLGNMFRLPIIFVSGIFIPLQELPSWGRVIAFVSPLTYCNNLMNLSITGTSYLGASLNLLALLFFLVVFLLVGTKLQGLSKRV